MRRWARAYGSRLDRMLDGAGSMAQLGAAVVPGLHEIEIDFLRRDEWVRDAQDLLWRRSKLGLHLSADQRETLARHMAGLPAIG